MAATPNLGIVYLSVSMASKEVAINAGWDVIDSLATKKTGDTMSGALTINVTSAAALNLKITDTGGGADVPALRPTFLALRHFTSSTTVPGVGHGIDFRTKDGSGTEVSIGRTMCEITTVTAGSVESSMGWSAFSQGTEMEVFRIIGSSASPGARPATSDAGGAMFTGIPGFVGGKLLLRGTQHNTWTCRMVRDAVTSGNPDPILWIVSPTDTGLTASTEQNSVLIDCSASRQFATGALTNQREVLIKGPTYTAVGASTITTAATVHIFGAPVASTNVTLTNSVALWVQGPIAFGNNAQGTSKAAQTAAQGRNAAQPNCWWTQPVNSGTFTASTETYLSYWDPQNGTLTWATGNFTNQRENWFRQPTYTAAGASTITNSATVAIEGAPVAGTNMTITNPYALWLQAGGLRVTGHHCYDGGSAPAATAGANNGTSPPAPVVTAGANDTRGNLTFGSGTTPAAGAQVGVTFAAAYSAAAAPVVLLIPRNTLTQALGLYISAVSTSGFTISSTNAPAGSQANNVYSVDFLVMG